MFNIFFYHLGCVGLGGDPYLINIFMVTFFCGNDFNGE